MTDELKQWEYDKGYDKGKADMLKAIEDIKQEIENYMKNEGFGSGWIEDIKEIINKHITEEK